MIEIHNKLNSDILSSFSDRVLSGSNITLTRYERGSLEEDVIDTDSNVSKNFALYEINDYEFVVNLQNTLSGIVMMCCLYKENDFLGWHTNSKVNGYNLILTYADSNSSYFECQGKKHYDVVGWSYKTNHFKGEQDWHRVVSHGNRITVAMLFATEEARQRAIDKLSINNSK